MDCYYPQSVRKFASISILTCLTLAFHCQRCYAQDGAGRFLHWLKDDPTSMVADFERQELYRMAFIGVGVGVITLGDDISSRHLQQRYGQSDVLHFTNRWGEWKMAGLASAGVFATSMFTKNQKFQDAAFTSIQSLLMANLTVNTVKFLAGRERPYHQEGPYDFDFAELGSTSFPSGHTATAFAVLTPWVMYYPGPVTYSLMAIPVGTAIARVARGRHWLSDVTAGAAIGFSIGHYLAEKHLNLQSDRIQVLPSADSDSFSLAVNVSF